MLWRHLDIASDPIMISDLRFHCGKCDIRYIYNIYILYRSANRQQNLSLTSRSQRQYVDDRIGLVWLGDPSPARLTLL